MAVLINCCVVYIFSYLFSSELKQLQWLMDV